MRRVGLALAAGLALLAIGIGVTLSSSPVMEAGSNSIPAAELLANLKGPVTVCQAGEALPRGTSEVRLSLFAIFGPRLTVKAYSGGRVLTSGVRGVGWVGDMVAVPVRRLSRGVSGAKLCIALGPADEYVLMVGHRSASAVAATDRRGQKLPGRMRIEYVRPASRSWLSLATLVAGRMGVGHAPSGASTVLLLTVLMAAVIAAASWLAVRELR